MTLLASEQKAAKRQQVAEQRQAAANVDLYKPIVYKQARSVASQSGAPYDLLEGVAFEALAKALQKGEQGRPGFFRYVKMYVRGYLCNYLRDQSRSVRLPRDLTWVYLAEQRMLRTSPGFRELGDDERAEAIGTTPELLRESRTAISIGTKDLDLHDRADEAVAVNNKLQAAADFVQRLVDAGAKAVAREAKADELQVKTEFYAALRLVLEAKDSDD